eukprot:4204038-Pleurochrysis_carterae.AAC.1
MHLVSGTTKDPRVMTCPTFVFVELNQKIMSSKMLDKDRVRAQTDLSFAALRARAVCVKKKGNIGLEHQ